MRTSGGRGAEGWIIAIPVAAMLVAATMTNGGAHGMVVMLETTVRETITAVAGFLVALF
jgi:hypothetical protein